MSCQETGIPIYDGKSVTLNCSGIGYSGTFVFEYQNEITLELKADITVAQKGNDYEATVTVYATAPGNGAYDVAAVDDEASNDVLVYGQSEGSLRVEIRPS